MPNVFIMDEREYNILYAEAKEILMKHSPCGFGNREDGRVCAGSSHKEACCRGCKNLADFGCTVKALYCKVWLCDTAQDILSNTEEGKKALHRLNEIQYIAGTKHFLIIRGTFKDAVKTEKRFANKCVKVIRDSKKILTNKKEKVILIT